MPNDDLDRLVVLVVTVVIAHLGFCTSLVLMDGGAEGPPEISSSSSSSVGKSQALGI